jgi:hypothetical protein
MRRAAVVRAAAVAVFDELPLYELPLYELPFAEFTLNRYDTYAPYGHNMILLTAKVCALTNIYPVAMAT